MEEIQVQDQSSVSKHIIINIGAEEVNKRFDTFYDDLRNKVVLKGFRKGKAPRSVLQGQFGQQARVKISQSLFAEYYTKALTDHAINPLSPPNVIEADEKTNQLGTFSDSGFTVNVVVEVAPTLKPQGYSDMALKFPAPIDPAATVQSKLQELQTRFAEKRSVDRPAQLGDTVVVDFVGKLQGVELKGLREDSFTIERLGGGSTVPGFDDQVVGLKVDETKDFKLVFPSTYAPVIAGKEVDFHITVKRVIEVLPAALDDDLALLAGANNLAELTTRLEQESINDITRTNQGNLELQIIGKLAQDLKLEVPDTLVNKEKTRILNELQARGQQLNDNIKQNIESAARYNIGRSLITSAIYDQESTLEITPDEFDAFLTKHALASNKTKEEFSTFLANSNQLETFTGILKTEKVLSFIIQHAHEEQHGDTLPATQDTQIPRDRDTEDKEQQAPEVPIQGANEEHSNQV